MTHPFGPDSAAIRRGLLKHRCTHLNHVLTDDMLVEVLANLRNDSSHKIHPLGRLLLATDDSVYNRDSLDALSNTNWAIRALLELKSSAVDWLPTHLRTLASERDHQNCAAQLAEIRTAGYLAEAGARVERILGRTVRPDFRATFLDGEQLVVEVKAKQMDGDEARLFAEFNRGEILTHTPRRYDGVTILEHDVQPAGRPRPHESGSGEVVARKFSRIKADAAQASSTSPSVLWIDLQDDDWPFIDSQATEPVFLGPMSCFWSNGFWHAFYGKVDTPIFVGHCVHPRPLEEVPRMAHMGMFADTDAWAAVVLALPRCTVVFEHPSPRVQIPPGVLECLHRLPRFDLRRSYMNWPPGIRSVECRIEDTIAMLLGLASVARHQLG
ncbi:hypothetical protein [Sorangium sp. So ce693]|uniref:hypothetical protein n=1 Tax=Sorangium sp. So ce693 TaxID=3133318 RepID=UPI003F5E4008